MQPVGQFAQPVAAHAFGDLPGEGALTQAGQEGPGRHGQQRQHTQNHRRNKDQTFHVLCSAMC